MGKIPARPFGKTELTMPILALGGAKALEYKRNQAKPRVLLTLLEAGVRYIDTAASYNDSEEVIGEALQGHRQSVFLGTKSDRRDYDGAWRELERGLQRLVQITLTLDCAPRKHRRGRTASTAPKGGLKAFWQAKEQGLVKHIDISGHHDPAILQQMLKQYPFDMVLMPLNPAEWHHPRSFSKQLLPIVAKMGIGIAVMKVPALGKQLYQQRLEAACQFYPDFFHRLIIPFAQRFRSESYRRHLREVAERILDTDRIDFVAIDEPA